MRNKKLKSFTFTRVFNAKPEKVFNAWIDEKQLAKWWGPDGFTNPVCKLDVHPGGSIYIEMNGPDGVVYPMGGLFHEIQVPELLVFTSTAYLNANGEPGLEALNTVTFEDYDGNTKVTTTAEVLKMAREAEEAVEGMEEGWNQSFERLDQLVGSN